MLEPKFDPKSSEFERRVLYEQQHVDEIVANDAIKYHAITDADWDSHWMLYPVNSEQRAQIAEKIARYFLRETDFDFAPYAAGNEYVDEPVYLIGSLRNSSPIPIIAGAVGFTKVQATWVLTWIWIHPWERGSELTSKIFDALDELHGVFRVEAPTSPAMKGLLKKRNNVNTEVIIRG